MLVSEYMELSEEERQRYLGLMVGFERIRRVTGYLNPDARTWNDGKQAELRMRVKHNMDF